MLKNRKRVCFVTGTRAEFGLMISTLREIDKHPLLQLQIIATGMHLSARHGRSINGITDAGFTVDATVPWQGGKLDEKFANAAATGNAIAKLTAAFAKLKTDIVVVVGDRVEAFAAATAGHIAGLVVAHIHGGDRALGQVDDALRHAITKLAHIHFPATKLSAERIAKLGEDRWRIHRVGSPGIDRIAETAISKTEFRQRFPSLPSRQFALLVYHPVEADDAAEYRRAKQIVTSLLRHQIKNIVVVYPNNDPGCGGVIRCWDELSEEIVALRNVPRDVFLSLLRESAFLIGNSSSGIIEAASFGLPVIDIEPRQMGRERGTNVTTIRFNHAAMNRAIARIWNAGKPVRYSHANLYGGGQTACKIAEMLGKTAIEARLRQKLISY